MAGSILVVGAFGMYFFVFAGGGISEVTATSNTRWYVDETGKSFRRALVVGESAQITTSDGKKAWPAELCYWTKDGKPKAEPTAVLLNANLGKRDPTFCPDCDRLVVGMNPQAQEGVTPPPTQTEYKSRR